MYVIDKYNCFGKILGDNRVKPFYKQNLLYYKSIQRLNKIDKLIFIGKMLILQLPTTRSIEYNSTLT